MFERMKALRVQWRKRQADRRMQRHMKWFIAELVKGTPNVRWDQIETFEVNGDADDGTKARDRAIATATELMKSEAWDTPEAFERLRQLMSEIADVGERSISASLDEQRVFALGVAEGIAQARKRGLVDTEAPATTPPDQTQAAILPFPQQAK